MREFFSILKPGIIFGNIVTVSGGFFLGAHYPFNLGLLFITIIGMSCVIGSGCIFNNYIDRDIDRLMHRTQNRVLVQGLISVKVAMIYAVVLGLCGFAILFFAVNSLTMWAAMLGFIVYVGIYSLYYKRKSTTGTLVGAVAGAIPPVVGYTAVTNRFDVGAIILFMILFFWQMPHFYAISIYRLEDFAAAKIPILPLKKNIKYTKISTLIYVLAFTVAAVMPSFFGYTGYIYFCIALMLGLIWFFLGLQGFGTKTDALWSRKMFGFSILSITVLCLGMAIKI